MKKKVTTLVLVIALAAMTIAGVSLAYFTDEDQATNTFTVGSVDIELHEANKDTVPLVDAEYHEWLEKQVLMPGKDKISAIAKRVYVENTGKSDAYVRVHIAIPTVLDNLTDASQNLLHFNMSIASIADGKWNWSKETGEDNYYTTTIGDIKYNVYVVTYGTALKPAGIDDVTGDVTEDAIHQVYLNYDVTNEDIEKADVALHGNWNILVFAEGVQTTGFTSAFKALEASFGNPTTASNPWTVTP